MLPLNIWRYLSSEFEYRTSWDVYLDDKIISSLLPRTEPSFRVFRCRWRRSITYWGNAPFGGARALRFHANLPVLQEWYQDCDQLGMVVRLQHLIEQALVHYFIGCFGYIKQYCPHCQFPSPFYVMCSILLIRNNLALWRGLVLTFNVVNLRLTFSLILEVSFGSERSVLGLNWLLDFQRGPRSFSGDWRPRPVRLDLR